jgi:hypothetical protein
LPCAYRFLLQLYPSAFRKRFGPEMLELAEAAETTEWPLSFGDTSVVIIRSWAEAAATHSTATRAEPNGYLALGESSLTPSRLFQGFALAVAMILGLCYISSLEYWQLPSYPQCEPISTGALNRAPARHRDHGTQQQYEQKTSVSREQFGLIHDIR